MQKQLNKLLGEPTQEFKIKKSIAGSRWDIPLSDQVRISRMILKAKIFEKQENKKEANQLASFAVYYYIYSFVYIG